MSSSGRSCLYIFVLLTSTVYNILQAEQKISTYSIPAGKNSQCFPLIGTLKDETILCFFLKRDSSVKVRTRRTEPFLSIKNGTWNAAIASGTTSIRVVTTRATDTVNFPESYASLWVKICAFFNSGYLENISVNYNKRRIRSKTTKGSKHMNDTTGAKKENVTGNSTNETSICYGAVGKYASTGSISIAGVVLETKYTNETHSKFQHILDIEKNIKCIDTLNIPQVHKSFIKYSSNINGTFVNDTELCRDMYILHVNKHRGNQENHRQLCKSVNGRLLTDLERPLFLGQYFKNNTIPRTSCNLTELYWRKYQQPLFLESFPNERNKCRYSFWNKVGPHFKTVSCSIRLNCYACILPRLQPFDVYGNADVYHNNLIMMNDTIILSNYRSARFKIAYDDVWTIKSKRNYDIWKLFEHISPIGRHDWRSADQTIKLVMSVCNKTQFPCSNGFCVPLVNRCNGRVECIDESDELNCNVLEKKRGYSVAFSPEIGNISYSVHVNSMKPVSVTEGSAIFDLTIWFRWVDPRMNFWNLQPNTQFNCSDIWKPEISIFDRCIGGFEVEPLTIHSSCIPDQPRVNLSDYSSKDPFLDRLTKGSEQMLLQETRLTFEVPCHFYLVQYPFGSPICQFCIDPSATGMVLVPHNSSRDTSFDANRDLGEVFLAGIQDDVCENKMKVHIDFRMIYTYHLINTFIPGVLICVICYITFFFSEEDFSERITVSLTAVLVLAALFSQIAETSVKTSYAKLLDVWYVSLNFYCFAIVIFHTYFHKELIVPHKDADEKTRSVNLGKMHWTTEMSKLVFGVLFVMLGSFFIGAAFY